VIETLLKEFTPKVDATQKPVPQDSKRNRAALKRRKKTGNPDTTFDLRTEAYKLFGVDVTQIPGVETIALPLFSEIGRDLSNWPTGPYFTSWLALCPDNDISGGQVCGKGCERSTIEQGAYSDLPPIPCITASHLWETICVG
jgi:hypothetical protein